MKRLLLLLASAFVSANLMAQASVVVKLAQENGTPAPGVTVKAKKAKTSAVTNAGGIAELTILDKDQLDIEDPRYFEVSVSIKGWNPADTIAVPLLPKVPAEQLAEGANDELAATNLGKFSKYGDIYAAIKGEYPLLQAYGECVLSNRAVTEEDCALIVVDGKPGAYLSQIVISEVNSIEFLQANQAAIYGTRAKHGALVITTIGNTSKPLHK